MIEVRGSKSEDRWSQTEHEIFQPLPVKMLTVSPSGFGKTSVILAAADAAGVAFLNNVLPDNVIAGIDGGIDIAAGGSQEAAEIGRKHTGRVMPW